MNHEDIKNTVTTFGWHYINVRHPANSTSTQIDKQSQHTTQSHPRSGGKLEQDSVYWAFSSSKLSMKGSRMAVLSTDSWHLVAQVRAQLSVASSSVRTDLKNRSFTRLFLLHDLSLTEYGFTRTHIPDNSNAIPEIHVYQAAIRQQTANI